jgi:hypothetical protein
MLEAFALAGLATDALAGPEPAELLAAQRQFADRGELSRVLVTGSCGGPQGGHGVHTAPDIAEAIAFSVATPPNVNVVEMVVVPVRQG